MGCETCVTRIVRNKTAKCCPVCNAKISKPKKFKAKLSSIRNKLSLRKADSGNELKYKSHIGTVKDGIKHGPGTEIFSNGDIYEGQYVQDHKHGIGVLKLTSGAIFNGVWRENKQHGAGVMTCADGCEFSGNWKDGCKSGPGKVTYHDGSTYEGIWLNDTRQLSGSVVYSNGDLYTGDCMALTVEDEQAFGPYLRHGVGTMSFSASGNKYAGQWVKDVMEGNGHMTYTESGAYEGEWKDNQHHGRGTFKHLTGPQYEGEWVFGVNEGLGVAVYADGSSYTGQWVGGRREGTGKMTYANGDVYDGQWVGDEKCGNGIMRYCNGRVFHGEWKGGMREGEGVMTYTSLDPIVSYSGGWVAGERHGIGVLTFRNGKLVEGLWDHGKPAAKSHSWLMGQMFKAIRSRRSKAKKSNKKHLFLHERGMPSFSSISKSNGMVAAEGDASDTAAGIESGAKLPSRRIVLRKSNSENISLPLRSKRRMSDSFTPTSTDKLPQSVEMRQKRRRRSEGRACKEDLVDANNTENHSVTINILHLLETAQTSSSTCHDENKVGEDSVGVTNEKIHTFKRKRIV